MIKKLWSFFKRKPKYGLVVCNYFEKRETEEFQQERELAMLLDKEVDSSIPQYNYRLVPFSFHLKDVSGVTSLQMQTEKGAFDLCEIELPYDRRIVNISYKDMVQDWLEYLDEHYLDYTDAELPQQNSK